MSDSKRVRISKREGALMASLAAKEAEVYEVQACARDLYRARRPTTDFARQVYTDPAINVEFQLMTAQLAEMENSLRLKDAELKELRTSVNKDKTSEANDAKGKDGEAGGAGGEGKVARASALVARCQRLEQENEELAASADVAKVAQLTSEKAVAEAYAGELKTALEEAYEYIEQLEEEREVNSNKVYALEQELLALASRQHEPQQAFNPYDQGYGSQPPSLHQSGGAPQKLHDNSNQIQGHRETWEEQQQQQQRRQQTHEVRDRAFEDGTARHRGREELPTRDVGDDNFGGDEGRKQGKDSSNDSTLAPPPPPPPPPPPQLGQGDMEDMDDLYGDIGGGSLGEDTGEGEAQDASETPAAQADGGQEERAQKAEDEGGDKMGDPMEEEGKEEAREEVEPTPTRARYTRRSSRRR